MGGWVEYNKEVTTNSDVGFDLKGISACLEWATLLPQIILPDVELSKEKKLWQNETEGLYVVTNTRQQGFMIMNVMSTISCHVSQAIYLTTACPKVP